MKSALIATVVAVLCSTAVFWSNEANQRHYFNHTSSSRCVYEPDGHIFIIISRAQRG